MIKRVLLLSFILGSVFGCVGASLISEEHAAYQRIKTDMAIHRIEQRQRDMEFRAMSKRSCEFAHGSGAFVCQ